MEYREEINKTWSDSSKNYDDIIHDELSSFRVKGWQQLIQSQLGNQTLTKVLDMGCGPGFFTIILSKAGYDVTAIDGADGMLEKAKRNFEEQGINASVSKMYCDDLLFPDNTFDLLVSRNVTHALLDHVKTYREWLRVLKPGGILLIFDANWHLPLTCEQMYLESKQLLKQCIETFGSDFNGHTSFDDTALNDNFGERRHALGDKLRPDWDMDILEAIGYKNISCDRDITEVLWDKKEKLIYKNTPMFMLKAVKPE